MPTDTTNTLPETVNEQLLIEQLGIPLKKIRALRPQGVQELPGVGVFWPVADARALATHMGVPFNEPEPEPTDGAEDLTVVSTPNIPYSVVVGEKIITKKKHFQNPRVIRAVRKNGAFVYVQVSDPGKFAPFLRRSTEHMEPRPMVIRAMPPNGGVNWMMVGREPAHPAQW